MKNFWLKLPRPFFVLAPMADVTDAAFRRVIAKYGRPDVFWTEFVSADGLMSPGRPRLLRDLEFTAAERPIVAQLFSARPAVMEEAARLVRDLGFDGLDINMGCPDWTVEKQGSGAALIKNYDLARELIRAAKRGSGLPVSVKTRVGYNREELETWLPALLAEEPAAVTLHARTRKELSKVPARWSLIKEAVAIRDRVGSQALIIGNGDVLDLKHGAGLAAESGADGVMLGRAIFGNPWLFANLARAFSPTPTRKTTEVFSTENLPGSRAVAFRDDFSLLGLARLPDLPERLEVLIEHTKLFEELLGDIKSFAVMKKHFKAYVNGFSGAVELRQELMATDNAARVETVIKKFLRL